MKFLLILAFSLLLIGCSNLMTRIKGDIQFEETSGVCPQNDKKNG